MPAAFFSRTAAAWSLGNKGKGTVSVNGDNNRDRQTFLQGISFGVERFAEFHDVHALLTQCWADRMGSGSPYQLQPAA